MSKKKYVPPADHAVVEGIGPNVDLNSLPVNDVTEAIKKDAVQQQKKMELIRAGVTETPPSEPLHAGTTKSFGVPMSDRNYNNKPEPFTITDKKGIVTKSMSHEGTVIEKR